MAKPLHLFIRPPYNDWTLVYGFGPEQPPPPPPAQPVFNQVALLRTTGAGEFFAAVDGRLSSRPPGLMIQNPTFPLPPIGVGASSPTAVNLYLHISPSVAGKVAFRARAASIYSILAFAYLNVERASLEGALGALLDAATIPQGALPRAEVVDRLIRGQLDVHVTSGHAIGTAATDGAPAGSRQVAFTVITRLGSFDPAHSYDLMRDFVEDGQPDLDALLALMPKRWPVIDAGLSKPAAIARTQSALYPLTVLQELRTSRNLTADEWRQVGNNQKNLWRRRLLRRVGHPLTGSNDPPFEFDDFDWKNIFQLEAVVELFANYDDPWAAGATPSNPGDASYITIDFLDLEGQSATIAGNVATLNGNPDLSRVTRNHDTIFLENDTARASRTYLISDLDDTANTVTLDANPAFVAGVTSSSWRINYRPVIVIIDSFGGRLNGGSATAAANVITLGDPTPDLSKVNPDFDTIYLPSDTARATRTYRITAVDDGAHTVTLDGNPSFPGGGSSAWHIQAGISGELPALFYNLGPGGARGYDHFDGILFVVKNGELKGRFRWSSYSSRNRPPGHQFLSSLRGNKLYDVSSTRSTNAFRNYSFKVVDFGAAYDGVPEARFYFSTPVAPDTAPPGTNPNGGGKTVIRLHHSVHNRPGGGCSSAGCLVAPVYVDFRTLMIELQQEDHRAVHGAEDPELQKLWSVTQARSQQIWNHTDAGTGTPADRLTGANWRNRIKATLWPIRPDERPL